MNQLSKPRRLIRRLLRVFSYGCIASAIAVAVYGVWLYERIETRFSGQRWQLPSKIYSDVTLLYPGLSINRRLLLDQLARLEYRAVKQKPERSGEMRAGETRIDLFLHALKTPDRERAAFPVVIHLDRDRIASIRRSDNGEALSLLEIEPEEIDLFFGPEREKRRLVSIDQVPPHLIQAVLTAEDNRYFSHHGIDFRGILRAAFANLRHGEIRQGGSTITQQLAKNYFLTPERTFTRKLRELMIALILELRYDKRTILEIYFNEIYLGQKGSISVNGVGEASWFYFGKPVEELSLPEAATIAALIRGPNAYSPYLNPERCERRRRHLLDKMYEETVIGKTEWQAAREAAVEPVGYEVFAKRAPYFVDFLSQQLTELYSPEALASLGLSIYTTLDAQLQQAAEAALTNGLERLEKDRPELTADGGSRLQGAVVVLQPRSGAVLAMVGGRDYGESQFNRVTQARRQAGSTFKPFVYLSGLDQLSPISVLPNTPATYTVDGKDWQPRNFSETHRRAYRLREALAQSINRSTVHLAMAVGVDQIVDTAAAFGFSTPLPPYPSLALGAVDVIPIELARAYGVFAAGGIQAEPLTIRDVLGGEGEPLERRDIQLKHVLPPAKAYLMTSLLESVIQEGTGKGVRSWGIRFPVAGKTGTTNNYRDAWFVGYTPDLLMLVWVGFDDGASIGASGAQAALPIWAELARAVPHRFAGLEFVAPPGIVRKSVCLRDTEGASIWPCQEIREEVFLEGKVPDDAGILPGAGALIQRLLKGLTGEKEKR